MNRVLFILTIETENLPANFPEIIQHERAVIAQWREEGILEQLFLRPTRNGAVLIFQGIEETAVRELVKTLPLYPFMKSEEFFPLIKDF
ncbi:muconolactone Delta-isomerase family protein [Aquirufa sp. ROCK2-A2]